jgi:beta-xylosidase
MRDTTERGRGAFATRRGRRVAWFVVLYLAGLAFTLLVAYGLKSLVPGT